MKIEVLGMGCPKCHKTRDNIEIALSESGKEAEIVEVKDLAAIAGYGVMLTPSVVVDGDVKIVGKVPSVAVIKSLIE
jgi:small redox-active disulfide protein 2